MTERIRRHRAGAALVVGDRGGPACAGRGGARAGGRRLRRARLPHPLGVEPDRGGAGRRSRSSTRLARSRDARDARGSSVVVTNEVGLGIVPMHELARRYRDTLGRVNAAFVSEAERASSWSREGAPSGGGDADVTATLDAVVVRIPRPRDEAARGGPPSPRCQDQATRQPRPARGARVPSRGDPGRGARSAAAARDRRGGRRSRRGSRRGESVPAGGHRADARELRERRRGRVGAGPGSRSQARGGRCRGRGPTSRRGRARRLRRPAAPATSPTAPRCHARSPGC